jgi:predicted DNA-binding transcriptional regulator YafY
MFPEILDSVTSDRFFSLLLALQSRETMTTADLAAQVGVSVRTVLRDLQWLQEAGFPLLIRRGRWGGVTLLPVGDPAFQRCAELPHRATALIALAISGTSFS